MIVRPKRRAMVLKFITRNKQTILYGISLALLLFLLKWLELRFIIIDHAFEIYIGFIALIFTGLGIWLALKLSRPRIETVVIEKEVMVEKSAGPVPDLNELEKLNLSKRELEVLQLMADGLSNQEIADRLFLSLNTIKTHSLRLFSKMDVERRTQAVDKAKKLNIIR
ncbi:response regulator transcription factor [Chitinophaga sp. S165]|uniref:response regulator transcription factor n=1 Tax=Chitinophaga sp. S165 TaxID=2135462 RepID=UPI0018EE62A1|nr:LuxR C-terminal-related transcriptional regulator [Chitinophaga sp. S165]